MVRKVKKMVPAYDLPGLDRRSGEALARGARHGQLDDVAVASDDLAFLQYTGGTTGVSKGAMLTHRNIIANMEQSYGLDGALAERGRGGRSSPRCRCTTSSR